MNVNSIKVNNNNNNNYDIKTNNICQSHKYIKFGASNNDYITLKNKDEEKSAKRKRNWIIASVCTVGLAIVAGICYFNGKKVNKTVNKEKIQEKLPKINEKSLDTYIKDLNDQKVNHKKLAQNITELNNLLKNNPDEEIVTKIINYMNLHFMKIIQCKNMEISERIQYLDDYLRFTQSYFHGTEDFDEICDTIKANKNLLKSKSKISKDIEANNKSLKNILQSKASIEYKKEFIEKLLEVTENNNIDTILNTISNNTTIDNKDISSIENNICGNILTISTHNNPSVVMTYLHDLSFKNIKSTDTKIDNALLTYGIITQNKIITLIKNLSSKDKLKNYTLDNDKLIYKTDNKTYTFDFNNNSYKVSQNTESVKKKEVICNFSNEEQENLKQAILSENNQEKIVNVLSKYRGNTSDIRKILSVLNNTAQETIDQKQSEVLQYFKNKIDLNMTPEKIIQSLQETITKFYPKDNDNLLQQCLVGNIERYKECHDFDDKMIGLVYGLGVCRHMAKLVNYLIKNAKLNNIQACAIDNGGHAWNYLKFKNNDNSYTYYKVDTYFQSTQPTNPIEITSAFKQKYKGDVSIDNIFDMSFY